MGNDLRNVRFLRPKEDCLLMRVSPATLYCWINKGLFPAPLKFGRTSLWREDALTEFLEKISGDQTQLQT